MLIRTSKAATGLNQLCSPLSTIGIGIVVDTGITDNESRCRDSGQKRWHIRNTSKCISGRRRENSDCNDTELIWVGDYTKDSRIDRRNRSSSASAVGPRQASGSVLKRDLNTRSAIVFEESGNQY